MCALLARQEPTWTPGLCPQGESALFYGHLLGQVVRHVDGRSIGRFLRDEICGPHHLDFHIGLGDAELTRVADLTGFDAAFRALQQGAPGLFHRAIANPPGTQEAGVVNGEPWRRAEVPAVNGHGTARAVAGFYVALAQGGLLSPALATELTRTRGRPGTGHGRGREWGFGVTLDADGYGMGGLGGSFGRWSEVGQYAAAFLTGYIGNHDRADRLENLVRETLGLPPQ